MGQDYRLGGLAWDNSFSSNEILTRNGQCCVFAIEKRSGEEGLKPPSFFLVFQKPNQATGRVCRIPK
jgi:hypothetical protein